MLRYFLFCNFHFSLDFDDLDSDPEEPTFELSPELHEKLNKYLAICHRKQKGPSDVLKVAPVVRNLLAYQRIQQLFPSQKQQEIQTTLESDVQARAALTLIDSTNAPILMKYRTINLGTGGNGEFEIDLQKFGHCNYVSRKHACIYFDQLSQVN